MKTCEVENAGLVYGDSKNGRGEVAGWGGGDVPSGGGWWRCWFVVCVMEEGTVGEGLQGWGW